MSISVKTKDGQAHIFTCKRFQVECGGLTVFAMGLRKVFMFTGVENFETLDALRELHEEIQILIDAIESNIKNIEP